MAGNMTKSCGEINDVREVNGFFWSAACRTLPFILLIVVLLFCAVENKQKTERYSINPFSPSLSAIKRCAYTTPCD